jgi:hypothetical protein
MELELPEKIVNRIRDLMMTYNITKSQMNLVIDTFVDATNPEYSGTTWQLTNDCKKIIKLEEEK